MSTQPDMWRDKPERPDRTTTSQTLETKRRARPPRTWPKAVLVVLVAFGVLWGIKLLIGW